MRLPWRNCRRTAGIASVLVVLVQRRQFRFGAGRGDQPGGVTRVLAEDQIRVGARSLYARGDRSSKVADRCGNQHKSVSTEGPR